MKCTQCDSNDIITGVRAVAHMGGVGQEWNDLSLQVYGDPNAMLFKDTRTIKLDPVICADCGFVMFKVSARSLNLIKKINKKN